MYWKLILESYESCDIIWEYKCYLSAGYCISFCVALNIIASDSEMDGGMDTGVGSNKYSFTYLNLF